MHRSPHHGSSVEFAEHKEYSAGDEIKHIDWKAYGKFDKYYVKRFEEETELRAYLLRRLLGVDGLPRQRRLQARVRAHAGGVARVLIVAATRSSGDGRLRREAARLSAAARALGPPERSADRARRRRGRRGAPICRARSPICRRSCSGARSSCCFSDLLGTRRATVRHLLRGLRARKHDVVVFHLLDKDELTLPFEGTTIFESMEDERKLLADPGDVRKAYLDELDRFIEGYRARAARRRRRVPPGRHLARRRRRCCCAFSPAPIARASAVSDERRVDMSFLAPGYVVLTLLFAVPIAIHLIGRSRAKVRRFAAIELLLRSDQARGARAPRFASGCSCSCARWPSPRCRSSWPSRSSRRPATICRPRRSAARSRR